MYETEIIDLKKIPVFSLADVSQIVSGKDYAKKLIKKWVISNKIKKIKKNAYTFHEDPFLISPFLLKPSYITSASSLSYHNLITQIPKDVFCFTTKQDRKFIFKTDIYYFNTPYFFGFEIQKYENFDLPIATPEKAIIDSFKIVPISIFEEAIENINLKNMLAYLKTIRKTSLVKRIGYLLEENGFNVYGELKEFINIKYIPLEPLNKPIGSKNKKWRLIINAK